MLFYELRRSWPQVGKHELAFERMKVHIRSRGDRRLSGGVDLTAGLGSQSWRELLGKSGFGGCTSREQSARAGYIGRTRQKQSCQIWDFLTSLHPVNLQTQGLGWISEWFVQKLKSSHRGILSHKTSKQPTALLSILPSSQIVLYVESRE